MRRRPASRTISAADTATAQDRPCTGTFQGGVAAFRMRGAVTAGAPARPSAAVNRRPVRTPTGPRGRRPNRCADAAARGAEAAADLPGTARRRRAHRADDDRAGGPGAGRVRRRGRRWPGGVRGRYGSHTRKVPPPALFGVATVSALGASGAVAGTCVRHPAGAVTVIAVLLPCCADAASTRAAAGRPGPALWVLLPSLASRRIPGGDVAPVTVRTVSPRSRCGGASPGSPSGRGP